MHLDQRRADYRAELVRWWGANVTPRLEELSLAVWIGLMTPEQAGEAMEREFGIRYRFVAGEE